MATYKVLQDIEAEDKLLGPLSLRQFIYAIIVVFIGFIAFQLARAAWFLALPFVPPMIFFGLLAAPFGQTQSSEVWLLAKIRFFLFPRKRIWDQSGIEELVQITVPKKVEEIRTKGFDKEEAQSRLKALASTLDTRGWAIKNISPEMMQNTAVFAGQGTSDRLVEINTLPGESASPVKPSDDVLDPSANPIAHQMNQMMQESTTSHRQELLDRVRQLASQHPPAPAAPQANPATQTIPAPATNNANVVHPQPKTESPQAFTPRPIINNAGGIVHSPTPVQPATTAKNSVPKKAVSTMTTPANTDILSGVNDKDSTAVSVSHDDGASDTGSNEVVVSLR